MAKRVALALLAAAVALAGAAHLTRPRAALSAQVVREYRTVTETWARDEIACLACLEAEERDAALGALLENLRHGSSLVRARAARELRRLGPAAAAAIPELVEFLSDGGDAWGRVRDEIEDVLVAIGEEAVPAALTLIGGTDPRARSSGIVVLARIRGEASVPMLAPLLRDRDVDERAADRLARLGDPGRSALVAAIADESVALKALEGAVADAGKSIALPLAALLDAPDPTTRERAAAMLGKLGKNARPVADSILRALGDPAFGDRLPLVNVLSSLGRLPSGAVHDLTSVARDLAFTKAGAEVREFRTSLRPDLEGIRLWSARNRELAPLRVLADLGPDAHDALPALREIMDKSDPDAGAAAARAYWRISGDPKVAVDHLIASLDRYPGGSHPAIDVLAEMGSEATAAVPSLLHELESESAFRADAAAQALAAMGEAALPAVRAWLPTGKPSLESSVILRFCGVLDDDLVARFGDDAREMLGLLGCDEPERVLLGVDEEDALPELRRKLHETAREDFEPAFMALGFMGAKAAPAVPDLVAFLDDDRRRAEAAEALAAIGPPAAAAVPALEPYLEDPWSESRFAVIDALWRITGDTRYRDLVFAPAEVQAGDDWALPRLLRGLTEGSASWRREVLAALGRLGPVARAAAPDLLRLAADEAEDEYVRDAAREALDAIGR